MQLFVVFLATYLLFVDGVRFFFVGEGVAEVAGATLGPRHQVIGNSDFERFGPVIFDI